MFGENDTFVVSGLFFPLSQTINFFSHFSLLFTTSHSSHMLKFMTSFQSHEIKSLGFIFPPTLILFLLLFLLSLFFPRSLTFARFGILSLPDCFHRLSYCQPFPFRSSFTASFSHEAYFDVSLAYYCFSFSNGYLIPVFLCTRFYYSFSKVFR